MNVLGIPVASGAVPVISGALWLWGLNTQGQLGDNTVVHRSSLVQTVAGGITWSSATNIRSSSASIKTDGTLWMWGDNGSGQLGDNTIIVKSSPVQTVAGGTNWSKVSSSRDWTGAIKTDGTLWMWGANSSGVLGDNTVIAKSSPVQTVAGGNNWSQIATSRIAVYGLKTDGTLWSWGGNAFCALGDNTTISRSSPVQTISGGTNWRSISANGFHVGAIKTDGTLWAWGDSLYGGFGNNDSAINKASSPIQTVSGGSNWSKLSVGDYHMMAIKNDGTLWNWGYNAQGSLGINNAINNNSSPVQTVAGGTNWSSVSAGGYHSTAIKTDGTLWAWGNNGNGGLGDNTAIDKSSPVQTLAGGTNWLAVTAGLLHTTAIRSV
jgi:alpha-tubulin suppressor-like RCC1 family protein